MDNDQEKKPATGGKLTIGTIIAIVLGLLLLIWIIFAFITPSQGSQQSYSFFIKQLQESGTNPGAINGGYFKQISIDNAYDRINVIFTDSKGTMNYVVNANAFSLGQLTAGAGTGVNGANTGLYNTMINALKNPAGVDNGTFTAGVYIPAPNIARQALFQFLPFILILVLMFLAYKFIFSKAGGGMGGFNPGKNQAERIYSKKRFSDIAGNAEVKEEVQELVDYLKYPKKYAAAGARIPKGILLGGPPGTGKTLIAKATAGEANVPFYFISGSNFVELFVGVGAKRVREMFKEARKTAPSIIFIDELDAVGRSRGAGIGGGNDEREQTLNQLLVEMDGITDNSGILIMAATNRPDVLDPALLRPGRFDRTITVGLPNVKEREEILRLHAKGKRISKNVDFVQIAKRTPGYSGAQLENVINEASLLSVRGKTDIITLEQIDEAIDRVMSGPAKKSRVITKDELTMIAYHEAGHAVVGIKLSKGVKVQKITIIPRGSAGGYNLMTPEEEKYNNSKTELIAMITSFMGGRAAEQIIYGDGEVSTGASNDIQKATSIARRMVTEWGMSSLGPIKYEEEGGSPFLGRDYGKSQAFSDYIAQEIDIQVRKIMLDAEQLATQIINENLELLELIKTSLLENETIVDEEIQYIAKNLKLPVRDNKNPKDFVNKVPSIDDIVKEVTGKDLRKPKPSSSTNTTSTKPNDVKKPDSQSKPSSSSSSVKPNGSTKTSDSQSKPSSSSTTKPSDVKKPDANSTNTSKTDSTTSKEDESKKDDDK